MAELNAPGPVTCTFLGTEWHGLLRDLVYVTSQLENYAGDVQRACDPRRDAWVLARVPAIAEAVRVLDGVVETLSVVQARPVPR